MAVPIVGTALGVASTVSSISSQNRQVAAQNAAVSAQISANEQSEQIRRMQNQTQRQIIRRSSEAERIARRTAFREQQNQLKQLTQQARTSASGQIQGARLQEQQALNQVESQADAARLQADLENANVQLQADNAMQQITNQLRDVRNSTSAQSASIMESLANSLAQVPDPTPEVLNAQRELDNIRANVYATAGGRGRTSEIQTGTNRQLLEQTMAAIMQGQQISADAAQELVQSEEFSTFVNELANAQAGLDTQGVARDAANLSGSVDFNSSNILGQLELARQAIAQQTDATIGNARFERRALASQARRGKQSNRLSRHIQDRQADINKRVALGGLISGANLTAAQTAAQNAALAAQRQPGVGLVQGIAGVAGQLTPLLGLFGNSNPTPTTNPVSFGTTPLGLTQRVTPATSAFAYPNTTRLNNEVATGTPRIASNVQF